MTFCGSSVPSPPVSTVGVQRKPSKTFGFSIRSESILLATFLTILHSANSICDGSTFLPATADRDLVADHVLGVRRAGGVDDAFGRHRRGRADGGDQQAGEERPRGPGETTLHQASFPKVCPAFPRLPPVSCRGASSLTRALDRPPPMVPLAARPLRAADADRAGADRGARPGLPRGRRRPPGRRPGRRLARLLRPLQGALHEGSYGGPAFHSEATSDWSPGAPWLYAGLFVVTGGPREGSIRILEALMGVGTILVVFFLGWRLGGRWPALLGALGVAIYPPFIHSVGEVMSEPPAMLSLPAAILAFLWAWDGKKPVAMAPPRLPLRRHRDVPPRVHPGRRRLRRLRRRPLGLAARVGVRRDRDRPDAGRPAAADRALDDPQHRRPRPPGADLDRRRQGPLRRHLLPRRRRIPAGQGDPLRTTKPARACRQTPRP